MIASVDDLLALTEHDPPRNAKVRERDRALLVSALALPAVTVRRVALGASGGNAGGAGGSWQDTAARVLVRQLRELGLLVLVSEPGRKPKVYEWAYTPGDLTLLRADAAADPALAPRYVVALEAEVDRLRRLVGEPLLREVAA